jgi:hypothetical protein
MSRAEYEVRTSRSGIDYVRAELKRKKTVSTQALFWKIEHKHGPELALRLGRYKRAGGEDIPAQSDPKSVLTLDHEELQQLVDFIAFNHEPLLQGARRYVVFGDELDATQVESLSAVFSDPDKGRLLEFLATHEIVPDDLVRGLAYQARCKAVEEFEAMLAADHVEANWQRWFEDNQWVLGSDFVEIVGERRIDVEHIADYLMKAYDGFLDLIEIKRPEGALRFWSDTRDHGNLVPHADLIRAIVQATRYLYEVEREANSVKFRDRVGGVKTVKPRCTLIFGRSRGWGEDEREAYRVLNASYHSLSILTYDHVLDRARRILDLRSEQH